VQEQKTAAARKGVWTRPRWIDRALRPVELVELTVGALLLLAIVVLVMLQVLARVTPIESHVWTGELARYCLLWLSFGLAGYLLGRDEHIALDVIDHVLPPLGQRIVRVFSLLVVAATAAMFGYEGLDLFASGSPIKTPSTGIPLSWIYFIPMVGMGLTVLRALLEIVFPAVHEGQIRVAGELIVEEALPEDFAASDSASAGASTPGAVRKESIR
jgi:TRAP-type C4-dicarboxylate transport system permease small subunit